QGTASGLSIPNGALSVSGVLSVASGTDPGASTAQAAFVPTRWRMKTNSGDDANAGSLDYRGLDASALSIVGAGTATGNRWVHIFDNLQANGAIQTTGPVTTSGASAGYSFQDRGGSPTWSWYAAGTVRLNNGSADLYTFDSGGFGPNSNNV